MAEATTVVLLFLAAAIGYATDRHRPRIAVEIAMTPGRVRAARLIAVAAVAAGFWRWRTIEQGPASVLVVIVGLMSLATLIAIVAPLRPRAFWASTAIAAIAAPILLALGALS